MMRIMSWFTTECICEGCHEKEIIIKEQLKSQGHNINDYEGIGYVPKLEEVTND